jgi:hypothetical protein
MMDAVNAKGRLLGGKMQYPTMHGAEGWYGWTGQPWNIGALETWYWSMSQSSAWQLSLTHQSIVH